MELSRTLRVRGLPWQASPQDIVQFFDGCQIKDGEDGISMLLTEEGRPSGEAIIEMESAEHFEKGLECHKKHMGSRYIEVFAAQPQDLVRASRKDTFSGNGVHQNGSSGTGSSGTGSSGNGSSGNEAAGYVRLRGLPYGCRRQQIEEFFEGLDIPQDGIVLPTDHLGRSSGEAYVKFASKDQADTALGKNKERIGHRYIEIFKSSPTEFRSISYNASRSSFLPSRTQGAPDGWFAPPYRAMEGSRMRYNLRVAPYDRFLESPRGPYGVPYGMSRPPPPFRRPPEWEDYYFRDRLGPRYPGIGPGPIYSRRRHVVHMRGLPFKASQSDVHEFFRPLQPINVRMLMDGTGRSSGEADVEFSSHDEAVRAMNKDKANMQHRYIELFLESEPSSSVPPQAAPHHHHHHHHHPPPQPSSSIPPPLYGGMRSYHSQATGNDLSTLYGSGAPTRQQNVASREHDFFRNRV